MIIIFDENMVNWMYFLGIKVRGMAVSASYFSLRDMSVGGFLRILLYQPMIKLL